MGNWIQGMQQTNGIALKLSTSPCFKNFLFPMNLIKTKQWEQFHFMNNSLNGVENNWISLFTTLAGNFAAVGNTNILSIYISIKNL